MNNNLRIAMIGSAGQQGQEYFHLLEQYSIVTLVDSYFEKISSWYAEKNNCNFFSHVEKAIQPALVLGSALAGMPQCQEFIYMSVSLINLFKIFYGEML